jgi:SAM-dependent methyltransferase
VHVAREMMFGGRQEFRYQECGGCGRLRLIDVPSDLGAYYPDDYYSFSTPTVSETGRFSVKLRSARASVALRLPPALVDHLVGARRLPGVFRWLAGLRLSPRSAVADVGSGSGQILEFLAGQGFSRLSGFDPYLPGDLVAGSRITLHRAELDEISGCYDLVMMHHAFEHMPDPQGTMQVLAARLAPGGALLIRTPVADSWAWRHYGVDWVQLDAPRHLYIHTTRSLGLLAAAHGLRVYRSFRDSIGVQFWGSELYVRGLPLKGNDTRLTDLFPQTQLREFERRAEALNAAGTGDSVCIVLRAV